MLSRVSSSDVTGFGSTDDSDKCRSQKAAVWDGITTYCYDCVQIEGCGYCGGKCVAMKDTDNPDDGPLVPEDCEDMEEWTTGACDNPYGTLSVVFMVLYLLAFGIGMGGMPWTINSEIYPLQFRSLAVSFSTTSNWLGNIFVSATFLTIRSPAVLTAYGAFWLYACVGMVGYGWLHFALPETKGLSLEEIEGLFTREGDEGTHDRFENLNDEDKRKVIRAKVNKTESEENNAA